MIKVFNVSVLFLSLMIGILTTSCKDAIVVFDNEECIESIVPTNLPQQSLFYSKDWILYQQGNKADLNLYEEPLEVRLRFSLEGTGTIVIIDSIISQRVDSSVYHFTYRFCKTDCNCNILKLVGNEDLVDKNKDLVNTILSMKMYSAVTIPINNGANAINGLLLMDAKETTMTFR